MKTALRQSWVSVSAEALYGVPRTEQSQATIIPNAVDPTRLEPTRPRAEVRQAWGVPEGALVAGYLGRLAPEKNPLALARAADHLPDPWHVVVVGAGSLESVLRRIAPANLHAVGSDLDVGSVLAAFDCLVVPSSYETFGLTIAEGLWLGVPVISTPVGLVKEYPGLTREIPIIGADGPTLAAAILADQADAEGTTARLVRARDFARRQFAPERFGREWTDYLVKAGRSRPVTLGRSPLALVHACPDRGSTLPLALQPSCGCASKELTECRAGHGTTPGRVTLKDCLDCRTRVMPGA